MWRMSDLPKRDPVWRQKSVIQRGAFPVDLRFYRCVFWQVQGLKRGAMITHFHGRMLVWPQTTMADVGQLPAPPPEVLHERSPLT
jgi:hypothetical protein